MTLMASNDRSSGGRDTGGTRRRSVVAWHGWTFVVPDDWSPVKLEGDAAAGYALLADLERPRLGVRWATPPKKRAAADAEKLVRQAMRREVGQLAAEEAKPFTPPGGASAWSHGVLYLEADPPGRDVWIAASAASGRVVEIVHHAHRRSRALPDDLLPTLADGGGGDGPVEWSVFGLSVRLPRAMTLLTQRLHAGDLALSFAGTGKAHRRDRLTVRQVAAAGLALSRRPLDRWLAAQEDGKHFRVPSGKPEAVTVTASDGRELVGFARTARRRRRFFWKRSVPPQVVTYALHDAARDRLVIVQGTDDALAKATASTVGWATA
jgi:hypothetical protein